EAHEEPMDQVVLSVRLPRAVRDQFQAFLDEIEGPTQSRYVRNYLDGTLEAYGRLGGTGLRELTLWLPLEFRDRLRQKAKEAGVSPEKLASELIEKGLRATPEKLSDALRAVRKAGLNEWEKI